MLQEGETPITKNITVVDENGKEYENTYIKRAKGLVKNGRARFIDENTICLACPEENTEDKEMTDIILDKQTGEVIENARNTPMPETPQYAKAEGEMPTLGYILERIESIANDSKYIHEALSQLSELKAAGAGDICGQSKADAIAHVVDAREETNRKLLAFYEMLYRDVQNSVKSEKRIPKQLIDIVSVEEDSEARMDMFHDLCIFFGESDK